MTFEATESFFLKNDALASDQCAISTVCYSGDLMCTLLKLPKLKQAITWFML